DDMLAGRAVERVVEAVAVGEHDDFPGPAVDRDVGQHWHLRRVPVVDVVRRELEVPADLAGVCVDRDQGAAVKVVALPAFAVIVGTRVAGAIEQQVLLGVVGTGGPDARSADLPRVALPGAEVLVAGAGNREGTPGTLAGLRLV